MATAGAKVTVASKLPMAFEMQACTKHEQKVKTGNTTWVEEVFSKSGKMAVINGIAYPNGQAPEGFHDKPQMASGAALTFGVDKDLWDAWLEQNKDSAMVRNGLVFAHEKSESVKAKAREHKDLNSGLGPLTPDNDRRMPKKISSRDPGFNKTAETGISAE